MIRYNDATILILIFNVTGSVQITYAEPECNELAGELA